MKSGSPHKSERMRRSTRLVILLVVLYPLLLPWTTVAQEQQQGLCAQIKMVISQQLTLERIGFQATLQITDNDPTDPITDFAANLTFENPLLSTNGIANDSSSLFFVQPPTLQSIQGVDGTGSIGPGQTATVTWFIIPTVNAGGTTPNGLQYRVGAALNGKLRGVQIPAATLAVYPAQIGVRPDAQLQISYFQPRDVMGDNPFTPQVESPIPFTFGVLVQNVGYGVAHDVIINSQQPRITDNKQNLLVIAQLLGSRVNDSALSNANLTVDLGDLQPGQTTKGAWDMIVSLSGTFLAINATYTHSTDLGGAETSLIKSINAYLFLHEVLDDQPGRDTLRDFLADTSGATDAVGNLIPDSLYESDGGVFPVNFMTNASVIGSGNPVEVSLNASFSGLGYIRLTDPAQATLPIAGVVRSDSKVLNANNYWTSLHYEPITNIKDTYLNIFDLVNPGSYTYTVTYANPIVSTNPPVTTLMFAGPSTFTNGAYYITPATQMYFVSQDATAVSIFYSLTNGPFVPAYPFSLLTPGQYQLVYYATDASGNHETNHTALLVVAGSASLGFASMTTPSGPLFLPGDALSIRPGNAPISFQALANPLPVNARVDIFQGVVGWATLAGAPSSPTASTSATLTVGGQNVDFYIYQLNANSWSSEQPVDAPISLTGLSPGTNTISVLGRSQYGAYMNPTQAASVSRLIDSAAPPTVISGAPASPAQSGSAQLTVSGSGVTSYRWATNNGFYNAETVVANPIVLSNLADGPQLVSVLGKVAGVFQATNHPTSAAWTVNSLYGFDMSALPAIRSTAFTNVGTGLITFNWDGRSDAAVIQPQGWYTARVTLTDALGHTNFAVGLVQISSPSGLSVTRADVTRGPMNPYARGRWVVWQDQSDGNWEVYAQDLTLSNSPIVKVTQSPLSQENPKTDGHYVVWQARQPNGNWDVYLKDMASTNPPQPVTSTLNLDEVNPSIDWPWVVFQTRPTGNNSAPWQVYARNLVTSQDQQVSPSTQDELDPDIQGGRVVWQDWRDVGPGEIYFQNLETAEFRRITTNTAGQYHPAIYGNWIVWQDNRNIETDIYGFDFLRNREIRITSTPEDETRPYLNGQWLACIDNALGPQTGNARLIQLPSLVSVPVTSTLTLKDQPALGDGWAVWQETVSNQPSVMSVSLPALQAVFQNRNVVAVTDDMAAYAQNAYGLLSRWATNGVQSVTAYSSLVPQVVSQTAVLSNGVPSGPNFALVSGSFLWVKFDSQRVLDLGSDNDSALNFAAGANVFAYTRFPDSYSAYQLLQQLGLNNVPSVRMLDAQSGRWVVAEVQNGIPVGNDFPIPPVAVLMVNLANPVSQFIPQSQ
jgi:beta propeller repeat protein